MRQDTGALLSAQAERKKKIRRIIACGVLILLVIAGIFAVRYAMQKAADQRYAESYGKVAAYVGKYEATYDLYRYFYLNYRDEMLPDYKTDAGTDTAALDRVVRERVGTALCGLYATLSLAEDYGITAEDGDVKVAATEYTDAIRAYYTENKADFAAELEKNYMTEQSFDFLMRVDAVEDKLFAALVKAGGVIESDDAKIAEILRSDAFVRAMQVFIENDAGESIEENRAIAEKVLEEYARGSSIETLIGLYSEDYSMPSEGYYFTYLEMIDEFETAAFALKDGEVSGVVESDVGFHVIFRLPKDEAYLTENFDELRSQYQNSEFYRMIDTRAAALSARETDYVRGLTYEEIR